MIMISWNNMSEIMKKWNRRNDRTADEPITSWFIVIYRDRPPSKTWWWRGRRPDWLIFCYIMFCLNIFSPCPFVINGPKIYYIQDGHSPDQIKFPDFSLTFPVVLAMVYRYACKAKYHHLVILSYKQVLHPVYFCSINGVRGVYH